MLNSYDELYDLEADHNEMINEINNPDKKVIIRHLYRKLWQFAYDNRDNIVNSYIMTAMAQYGPGVIFEDEWPGLELEAEVLA